jgi:Trypsin-co-occurring domain 2
MLRGSTGWHADVMDESGVSIAEAVEHLRAELAETSRRAAGDRVRFELGPVKLSLDVTVSRSKDARGGVRFWVVNAEAGADLARTQTHRVELELRPVIDGAANPLIASEHVEGP